ncbi:phage tail sheath subtilisin-like domain-containing protein [Salsuginibacillus kocurii]|uniref:phage tail sheath subtilisin-like domain-containing protein n=1 Tax=Salsuginibacillus kocurii TaxID=427078 RepID=UPI00036F46F6|nr:phage tail sheath subtilisin-like domain-containing protein [Salsuginibacillus kocurii]
MGMPEVQIQFTSKAITAIERSEQGIVALIIQDEEADEGVASYTGITDLDEDTYTEQNYDYIRMALEGTPSKVIVVNVGEDGSALDGVEKLKNKRFNYLAVPFADDETEDVATFITEQRGNKKKTFKAVLANESADNEGIINFTADNIEVDGTTYTTAEFTPRIAGVLAAMPLTRSATYSVLNEVESVTEPDDLDEAVEDGELFLVDDGEKIKISRAVNSLTDVGDGESDEWTKIKIVDAMDQIKDDIRNTFNDEYVGQVNNDYDQKTQFIAAVSSYFRQMTREGALDEVGENKAKIDVAAQREYLELQGRNVEDMSEQEIKEENTGSQVFLEAEVRLLDAMEDLSLDINV